MKVLVYINSIFFSSNILWVTHEYFDTFFQSLPVSIPYSLKRNKLSVSPNYIFLLLISANFTGSLLDATVGRVILMLVLNILRCASMNYILLDLLAPLAKFLQASTMTTRANKRWIERFLLLIFVWHERKFMKIKSKSKNKESQNIPSGVNFRTLWTSGLTTHKVHPCLA